MHMYERVCTVRQAEVKRSPTSSSGGTGQNGDGGKMWKRPGRPQETDTTISHAGGEKKDGGDGAGYLYDLKLPNEKTLRDEKRRGREESGSRCAADGCWLGFPKTERRSWRSPGANPVQLDIRSRP